MPTACAASVWKKTLCALQSDPISATGCLTPISLLTVITDTKEVSGIIAFSSSLRDTIPFGWTGKYVILNPSDSNARHESKTHLCS